MFGRMEKCEPFGLLHQVCMCWAAICFLNKLDINVMRYCHPARGASTLWPILEAKNQQFLSHFVLTVQDGGRHAKALVWSRCVDPRPRPTVHPPSQTHISIHPHPSTVIFHT